MGNGLSRLAARFLGEHAGLGARSKRNSDRSLLKTLRNLAWSPPYMTKLIGTRRSASSSRSGASFSPDALTGLEANLRFAGPETMETKIFGRLSAWQNWIFQRPNATGEEGALKRYGTGLRPRFDPGGCDYL